MHIHRIFKIRIPAKREARLLTKHNACETWCFLSSLWATWRSFKLPAIFVCCRSTGDSWVSVFFVFLSNTYKWYGQYILKPLRAVKIIAIESEVECSAQRNVWSARCAKWMKNDRRRGTTQRPDDGRMRSDAVGTAWVSSVDVNAKWWVVSIWALTKRNIV